MGNHASVKTSRTFGNNNRIGKSRSDLPKSNGIDLHKFHILSFCKNNNKTKYFSFLTHESVHEA